MDILDTHGRPDVHDLEHDHDRRPPVRKPARVAAEPAHDLGRALKALAAGRTGAVDKGAVMRIQRAAGNAGTASLLDNDNDERSPVRDVVGKGGGQPLDHDTRSFMEPRLGADLSDVRVHTDAAASESARSVQAHAYTVGDDVVFQSGKYEPESGAGRRMLAHELTHVVQQREGPVDGTPAAGGINVSDPSDHFEREAEHNADRVMNDATPATAPAPAPAAVQRLEDEEGDEVQGSWVQREAATEEEDVQGSWVQREAAPEEEDQVV